MLTRNLRYLLALSVERHFARAAAACQVTQPTLSAGIKHLEGVGLAQGIAAEAGTELAKLGRVKVLSGTTMEVASAKGWTSKTMADSLGIQYLIEGSVQRSGSEFVVSLRLINARTDDALWGAPE